MMRDSPITWVPFPRRLLRARRAGNDKYGCLDLAIWAPQKCSMFDSGFCDLLPEPFVFDLLFDVLPDAPIPRKFVTEPAPC